jgi:hypothetical protein
MSGRPGHDLVPASAVEPGVGRQIVRTAIRLDLDDAGRTPAGLVVADQARAKQCARRIGGLAGEQPPVEDGQAGLPG